MKKIDPHHHPSRIGEPAWARTGILEMPHTDRDLSVERWRLRSCAASSAATSLEHLTPKDKKAKQCR